MTIDPPEAQVLWRSAAASEVVREALRMMEAQDQVRTARLEQLRGDVMQGLDSGPAEPWDVTSTKRQARGRRTSKTS